MKRLIHMAVSAAATWQIDLFHLNGKLSGAWD
jgi:hypothetical protein